MAKMGSPTIWNGIAIRAGLSHKSQAVTRCRSDERIRRNSNGVEASPAWPSSNRAKLRKPLLPRCLSRRTGKGFHHRDGDAGFAMCAGCGIGLELAGCQGDLRLSSLRQTTLSQTVLTTSTNKRLLDEVASVPSKRLRNKISGCKSCIESRSARLDSEDCKWQ
jgi:hypothetical protein